MQTTVQNAELISALSPATIIEDFKILSGVKMSKFEWENEELIEDDETDVDDKEVDVSADDDEEDDLNIDEEIDLVNSGSDELDY